MIDKGSMVVLRTKDEIYAPCRIVAISDENVTVAYFVGMKKNPETGEYHENRSIKIIPRKKIIHMSERL